MATVEPAAGGWASFDPWVVEVNMPLSSTTATSKTINGREVRVALRFAPPPAASYVHLVTDDCDRGAKVVAADGDLLLICIAVYAAEGATSWRLPDNFFVCKADRERPWLEGLPSLGDRLFVQHAGIARCGAEDFVVADLQPCPYGDDTGKVAELFRYSCLTKQWELKRLDMPPPPSGGVLGTYPFFWETDAAFAFRGLMWWADYHRGILFCDVSADHPELRFLRFPGIEIWDDFRDGRGAPESYRTASVSQGRLWFVDIDDGRFRTSPTLVACTVTTWTLKMPELEWVKEHTLQLTDLWSHCKYRQSPLPCSVPEFPIVDMQRPDVFHFMVNASATMYWTITVDMKNGSLMEYAPYQNAIEIPEADVDVSNVFWDTPLICCKYT